MNFAKLAQAAEQFETPLYVYDADELIERFQLLRTNFGGRFGISFAVKSNPNISLLREIREQVVTFDVSSFAEFERSLQAGATAKAITFSGPVKRREEIELAITNGLGELVVESVREAELASAFAESLGVTQTVLLRINPEKGVRDFGVNMSGKPSQFGVDEENLPEAIARIKGLAGLALEGFHIYSGTNSLNAKAIAANFENFIRIFRDATALSGNSPKKLVFGSGFGVPYHKDETPLEIDALADLINPIIDDFVSDPVFSKTELVLEMGRWLVGPVGWLLSSVVAEKSSRGTEIRMFDAGFNNHLAACGMMGAVIRRNWRIHNITNPGGQINKYMLNGPLCTTIDVIASNIELPKLDIGNVIAIENSGAYGLTASPTRFISHPEPKEVMMRHGAFNDITESMLNHWTLRKSNNLQSDNT